jgi:hypothetical protein
MQIEYLNINDITPYENNPRMNDEAIEYVANSIKEFGFKVPIVIDKNNVIVCGHTRLKAAKQLNLDTVPCIKADDLTDEQITAFRLADNKTAEVAEWDFSMLDMELDRIIDIDMRAFNFEIIEFGEQDEEPNTEEEKENERERTYKSYNLQFNDLERTAGKYQMPVIQKEIMNPPKKQPIGFNYVLSSKEKDRAVHFFVDDYQMERVWNSPETYVEKLAEFDCVFTPDFSLYLDMPIAMQIWNTYRSRLIGQIMQDYGIKVIPTVSWGTPETFEFCFDGIEEGSIVVVSTIGVKRDENATKIWRDGMDEMINKIKPYAIWVYGGEVEYDYKGIPVTYFVNEVTERMKETSGESW